MSLRILQLGKFYPPDAGGIETVTQNLAEGLRARDHFVRTLCSRGPAMRDLRSSPQDEVIRLWRTGTVFSQPILPTLVPVLHRRMSESWDLVHLHVPHPLMEAAVLTTLPPHVPLFVSYHAEVIRQRWALPFYLPLHRRILKRARRIFVATPIHLKNPLLRPFLPSCRVIPFGVDLPPAPSASKDNDEAPILFVGRLVGYKGVDVLLKAYSQLLPEVPPLTLVGDGPLRRDLENLAAGLGIPREKISFLGKVEGPALQDLYSHCRFLVLPSVGATEAFGLVLIEAMAHAKAVVATRLGTGVEWVVQGQKTDHQTGLLIPPHNAEALAQAMSTLIHDPALARKLGAAGRARVESTFSLKLFLDHTEDEYRAGISEHPH